jgi:hypothetical protein
MLYSLEVLSPQLPIRGSLTRRLNGILLSV